MKRQLITMMIVSGLLAARAPGWAQEAKQDNMSRDKMSSDNMSGDNMSHGKMGDKGGNSKMKRKKSKKKPERWGTPTTR
jgi:pentapeptide MXKDX repeat protein